MRRPLFHQEVPYPCQKPTDPSEMRSGFIYRSINLNFFVDEVNDNAKFMAGLFWKNIRTYFRQDNNRAERLYNPRAET